MSNRLPKHLAELPADHLARLQTGFSRHTFGFATPGEVHPLENGDTLRFVGNFARQKDALAAATQTGGWVQGYLFGKLPRGWAVNVTEPAAPSLRVPASPLSASHPPGPVPIPQL
jgi:hypothetical protein